MSAIVWLRRDLQLHDNASINKAIKASENVQHIFVFDTDILDRFTNKKDRRISFIANALIQLQEDLSSRGGGLLILHGSAKDVLPKIANALEAKVFAGEDYEPSAIKRDEEVGKNIDLTLSKQHVILSAKEVLKDDGTPYKVFTPYSKQWRAMLNDGDLEEFNNKLDGKLANHDTSRKKAKDAGLKVIDVRGAKQIVEDIGYEYFEDDIWKVSNARQILTDFVDNKISKYKEKRDLPAEEFTSQLSPYLRFGLVTVRQCYNAASKGQNIHTWINELIWREFYAMILFHYPETVDTEFQEKYRNLKWREDNEAFEKWKEGQTGYPIIDAGMRQLKNDGWMHNRVRMLVASFLTKDLLIDWRWGEEHFAQLLMDYDQASNVGGWQWAASTGTDAAPYFRIFNPILQSKKFDSEGEYIRKYVPELEMLPNKEIHAPWEDAKPANYPEPMVDHSKIKDDALSFFKQANE